MAEVAHFIVVHLGRDVLAGGSPQTAITADVGEDEVETIEGLEGIFQNILQIGIAPPLGDGGRECALGSVNFVIEDGQRELQRIELPREPGDEVIDPLDALDSGAQRYNPLAQVVNEFDAAEGRDCEREGIHSSSVFQLC